MPTVNASGLHWLDGMDLWDVFGVFVESGSDDFLKFADKKQSIEHDWMDADGLDVDLSHKFWKDKDITLHCAMVASNEDDFWAKRDAFIAQLRKPGPNRIEVNEFGARSFYVFYKQMIALTRLTRLKDGQVALKFIIVFTQNELTAEEQNTVFIIDEDGRFIVT